jgi:hypothetical protein
MYANNIYFMAFQQVTQNATVRKYFDHKQISG